MHTSAKFFKIRSLEKPDSRQGFTLIELLVTMMVIMIISSLVIASISGGDGGNELNSAISRADSVFSLARSAAISRKTPVRVLVCNDSSLSASGGAFRRFLTVYYFNTESDDWLPFMEGEFLPQGIFVDIASIESGDAVRSWNINSSQVTGTLAITSTAPLTEDINGNWLVYEFHANGTARDPMSRFVVGRSIQAAPFRVVPNEYMRAGFVLFRSGKVVHFQSPEHLLGAIN